MNISCKSIKSLNSLKLNISQWYMTPSVTKDVSQINLSYDVDVFQWIMSCNKKCYDHLYINKNM